MTMMLLVLWLLLDGGGALADYDPPSLPKYNRTVVAYLSSLALLPAPSPPPNPSPSPQLCLA
jgi:hypothetical protein